MQKNKLNLHICGIHLLNPYKTVVSHLKFHSSLNFKKSSKNSTRLLKCKNHQNDALVKGHTIKTLMKAQKKIHFSLFCNLIRERKS